MDGARIAEKALNLLEARHALRVAASEFRQVLLSECDYWGALTELENRVKLPRCTAGKWRAGLVTPSIPSLEKLLRLWR